MKTVFSLTFLNDVWGWTILPGSNGPFWSLCYEVSYYIIFGTAYFVRSSWKWFWVFALLLFYGPRIALLFPLWLLGLGVYRVCKSLNWTSAQGRSVLIVAIAAWIASEALRDRFDVGMAKGNGSLRQTWEFYLAGGLFAAALLGVRFASVSLTRIAPYVRWIAGATFTLYLLHYPLLRFLSGMISSQRPDGERRLLLLVVTTVACVAVASFTERQKAAWRRLFDHGMPEKFFESPKPYPGETRGRPSPYP